MFKKFFSVILVVALVLLPMTCLAEGETMFAKIKLSDPKVTIPGMDEIDMTGLNITLTSAYDFKDSVNPIATITAEVMAGDVQALGGAFGINKEKVIGILNGLQNVYSIKLADAIPGYVFDPAVIEEFVKSMNIDLDEEPIDDSELEAELEKLLPMEEKGEEEIEFRGEKVNAKAYTISLTNKQFEDMLIAVYTQIGIDEATIKSLLTEANVDLSGEFTIYEVDENRIYVEGVYSIKQKTNPFDTFVSGAMQNSSEYAVESQDIQAYFKASVVTTDEDNMDMQMDIDMQPTNGSGESVKMAMNMVVAESDAFEDAVSMTMSMIMTMEMPEAMPSQTMTMSFELKPQAIENGWNYDYDFDMNAPGEMHAKIAGKAMTDDDDVFFSIKATDLLAEEGDLFNLVVEGKYAETEETYNFDGSVSFDMNMEDVKTGFSTKVAIDTNTSVKNQILPMEGMDDVDFYSMPESEFEALNQEAMSLMLSAGEKLMNVAGLQSLLEMGMEAFMPEAAPEIVEEVR